MNNEVKFTKNELELMTRGETLTDEINGVTFKFSMEKQNRYLFVYDITTEKGVRRRYEKTYLGHTAADAQKAFIEDNKNKYSRYQLRKIYALEEI